jgi:hypothetical protein
MSFNLAPVQVGSAAGWSSTAEFIAASLGAGTDRLFARMYGGVRFASDPRPNVEHLDVAVAADQPLSLDNRWHVCPVLTASYARGDSAAAFGGGGSVALGWIARNSPGLTVVPSATFGVRYRPEDEPGRRPLQRALEVEAVVGFILRGRVGVAPRAVFARGLPARLAMELTIDVR